MLPIRPKIADIYSDSRYIFGVARNSGMLWKQKGFPRSSRQKIKISSYVLELVEAIQLLKSLAIIKIPRHSMANTEERRGNHLAAAAKLEVLKQSHPPIEAPMPPAKVTGDLKENIMEAQHLAD